VAPIDTTLELTGPAAAVAAPPALLVASNVHRILGAGDAATDVLKGVHLNIEAGQYVSIVGASGSGKSTLLYLLGGLDRPSRLDITGKPFDPRGAVHIVGQETTNLGDTQLAMLRNRMVGFVFQFHYLLKEFSAQENVALPMFKLRRLSRAQAMDRAAELLKRLGLGDKLKRKANRLSGGEQQRVAVARAFAGHPPLLLADEPTGNLDPETSIGIMQLLYRINRAGTTVIVASHDNEMVDRMRRRVIELRRGRIVRDEASGLYGSREENTDELGDRLRQEIVDTSRGGVLDRSCAEHTSLTASLPRSIHDPLD
jgi:ABC-type lipoprotein export system ATPase subunit